MDPTIEEIKRRADIIDIVSQHVALRPAGGERFKACCPFHDEKTPSFYVSRDKGFYKCFGCGESGDVFKFLQKIENISFFEAKKQLAERYGVQLPKFGKELSPEQQQAYDERDKLHKIMAACAHFYREQFAGNKGLPARDYARTRGLSGKTLEKFGIGYAPDAWDALHHHLVNRYGFKIDDCVAAGVLIEREDERGKRHYDRYRHRLMFPIWDYKGQCVAFGGRALEGGQTGNSDAKYINSPEGPLFNKSRILYAWHLARPEVAKHKSLIVTEGYIDVISLHEAGFPNTIAPLGTALTLDHLRAIGRISPETLYFCFDGDSAGMRAALRNYLHVSAGDLSIRVVELPKGSDPDTFIRQNGSIAFEQLLRKALTLPFYKIAEEMRQFDLSDPLDNKRAIQASAEVLHRIGIRHGNAAELTKYIDWIADRIEMSRGRGTTLTGRNLIENSIMRSLALLDKKDKPQQMPTNPWKQKEYIHQQNQAEAEEIVSQTLSKQLGGELSGVGKAERLLLSTMLGNPSGRTRILEQLPPDKWTNETHREIAAALRQLDWNAPIDPAYLIETLPPEASQLVGELAMSDESETAATIEVIDDCIARIHGHWARQVEHEILELVRLKLDRSEPITEEERKAYNAAIVSTKRKVPVPKKD